MAPGAPAAAFPTCCSPSGAAAPRKSHWGWRGIPRGKHQGHVPRDACVKTPLSLPSILPPSSPRHGSSSRSSPLLWGHLEGRICALATYSLAKVYHLWTYLSLRSLSVNLHRNQVLGHGWEFSHFLVLLEIYN